MKDWIIIVGTLLILAIIIDGIRRKRNDRYGKIRMSPNMKKRAKISVPEEPVEEEKPGYVSELPNGGARVIGHRDPTEIVEVLTKRPSQPQYKKTEPVIARQHRTPEQTRLNLDESVPMLMESVDAQGHDRVEPHFTEDLPINNGTNNLDRYDENLDEDYDQADDSFNASDEYDQDEAYDERLDENETDYSEDEFEEDDEQEMDDDNEQESAQPSTVQEPEEVLVVNVMAVNNQMLKGSALLDTILQCGMRYGNMDIFHRYSDVKGEGAHLFSMANMVKPGTFDLDAMDEFETPGVSFFMTLPINADSMQTFDLMVDTARTLAETLGGELKDDQRSVMTKQTLEHCRERIRDYERQRLFRRPR